MSDPVLDPLVSHGLAAAVRAGMFRDEDEALREALSTWLAVKPNVRLEVAIEFFRDGTVTLNRAAEIAGLNRWQFQDLLTQRGLKLEVEADDAEELSAAAQAIRDRTS
jgi:predicted HTH domain antitoxin